jgi:hypothetical protein
LLGGVGGAVVLMILCLSVFDGLEGVGCGQWSERED